MKNTENSSLENQINKFIGIVIFSFYLILIIFGIISLNSPDWLKNISHIGRESESRTMKNYGDYFLNNKEYEMAIAQYNKAIAINPNLSEAYSNLGIAYKFIGDNKAAITHFEKALSYDSTLHDATYFNIAEILNKVGKPNKAISYYIKSAEISPFPLYALQKAGEILNNTKQWNLAIETFNKALENNFTMKNCYNGMLKRDYYLFLNKETKKEIKKFIDLGIDNIDLSSYDEKIFNKYMNDYPEVAGVYNQYGYTYAMLGNFDEAINYFNLALEIKPDFQNAKNNLNAAYSAKKGK